VIGPKKARKGIMYFGGLMQRIDIILPAYNPLPGWEDVVIQRFRSIRMALPELAFHLIIVNDGSTKLDEEIIERLQAAIPELQWIAYRENQGKGYALRQGVSDAGGDFILYTDIDWPYTEESMIRLIRRLMEGAEVVIGIRDEAYYKHLPSARRLISKWLRTFNAWFLRLRANDTQAGLKGFRKHIIPIFLSTTINRYLFDLEFIYLLSKQKKLKMESLPIQLREGITFSRMNKRILLQEGWNFLKIWWR
jgi:glycosyltransferase involved in cell wall biosynthesis